GASAGGAPDDGGEAVAGAGHLDVLLVGLQPVAGRQRGSVAGVYPETAYAAVLHGFVRADDQALPGAAAGLHSGRIPADSDVFLLRRAGGRVGAVRDFDQHLSVESERPGHAVVAVSRIFRVSDPATGETGADRGIAGRAGGGFLPAEDRVAGRHAGGGRAGDVLDLLQLEPGAGADDGAAAHSDSVRA